MQAEVRRVETTVHETGVAVADRTDVSYELGAVIDGAWVVFTRVPQGTVDAARAAQPDATSPPAPAEGPTMAELTPPAPGAPAPSPVTQPAAEGQTSPSTATTPETASSGGGTT